MKDDPLFYVVAAACLAVLVILMGTDHPPTSNDFVPLGNFRVGLGLMSLAIPVLCFPPYGLQISF